MLIHVVKILVVRMVVVVTVVTLENVAVLVAMTDAAVKKITAATKIH